MLVKQFYKEKIKFFNLIIVQKRFFLLITSFHEFKFKQIFYKLFIIFFNCFILNYLFVYIYHIYNLKYFLFKL